MPPMLTVLVPTLFALTRTPSADAVVPAGFRLVT